MKQLLPRARDRLIGLLHNSATPLLVASWRSRELSYVQSPVSLNVSLIRESYVDFIYSPTSWFLSSLLIIHLFSAVISGEFGYLEMSVAGSPF